MFDKLSALRSKDAREDGASLRDQVAFCGAIALIIATIAVGAYLLLN